MSELNTEMTLDYPLERVFEFFARPENLARITPPWLRIRIMTPSPIPMEAGTRIRYRIWLGPIPLAWFSEITVFEDQVRFVDEQLRGPYRRWVHTHEFVRLAGDRTLVRDRVEYDLPFGWFGRIVRRLVVRHQLKAIFDYRYRALASVFPQLHDPVHNTNRPTGPRPVAPGGGGHHSYGYDSPSGNIRRSDRS